MQHIIPLIDSVACARVVMDRVVRVCAVVVSDVVSGVAAAVFSHTNMFNVLHCLSAHVPSSFIRTQNDSPVGSMLCQLLKVRALSSSQVHPCL